MYKKYSHHSRKKSNGNKNNKKTFPIKMKEDVGMSKPQKYANKVRWDPKLNNHFHITLHKYLHYYKAKYKELYIFFHFYWKCFFIILVIVILCRLDKMSESVLNVARKTNVHLSFFCMVNRAIEELSIMQILPKYPLQF